MTGRPRVQFSAWSFGIDMGTWVREGLYLCAAGPDVHWAEVAPLDGYGQDTMADVCALLPTALDWLGKNAAHLPTSPDALPSSRTLLQDVPSLRWGAELLLAKLACHDAGMAIGTWLGGSPDVDVQTAGLLLRGDATNFAGAGPLPRVVKMKIGPYTASTATAGAPSDPARCIDSDAARIRELVARRPDIRIRLDANRTGTAAALATLLARIDDVVDRIDFIEEPLPAGVTIPAGIDVSLAADETLREAVWAGRLSVGSDTFNDPLVSRADVWVFKPSLHGGLTDVLEGLRRAQAIGKRVVWSSSWESGVGLADLREVASLCPDEAAGFGTGERMPHLMTEPVSGNPAVCPVAFSAFRAPDSIAVRHSGGTLTYRQFHDRISRTAAALSRKQHPSDTILAVRGQRTVFFCEVLFAAMRLGWHILPVSTRLPEPAQEDLLARAGAVWVGEEASHPAIDDWDARVSPGVESHMVAGGGVLVATSGTTGTPSLVALDWARMLGHGRQVNRRVGFGAGSSWAWSLPCWHVGGLSIVVRCAVAGGELVVGDPDTTGVPDQVTHCSMVPTQVDRLLRQGDMPEACILVGGGPVPRDLLQRVVRAGLRVRTTWGMTEAGSMISCSDVWTVDDLADVDPAPIHAGSPLPGIGVAAGANRLEVHSPWAARGHTRLLTSDAGYIDAEGRVVVTHRLDRVFISGGENIDPAVIEEALLAQPGVETARVAGIPDREFGVRPVAFVRYVRPQASRDDVPQGRERVLRRRLRALLPGYMVPDRIFEEPELPHGHLKWTAAELVAWAERNHERRTP